jgi:hypothetical protein
MSASNIANPISAEEIAVALDGIGAEASLDRVRQVAAVLDPERVLVGDRIDAVASEVELAWRGLQALAGKEVRTMDEGKALLEDALHILGASHTEWEHRGEFVSPWEFCEVRFEVGETAIPVGVSSGGVVSVDRDPFTPVDRRLNVEIEALVSSLGAARERNLKFVASAPVEPAAKRRNDFRPTEAMVDAAERVLIAEAALKVIAPIVNAYEARILKDGQWQVCEEFREGKAGDYLVLTSDRSYQMSDDDFAVFHGRCKEARDRAGLWVEDPEQCPKLVAEEQLRIAKRALIDSMEPVTKLKADDVFTLPLKDSARFVELTQNLLARHVDSARVRVKFAAWRAERESSANRGPEL